MGMKDQIKIELIFKLVGNIVICILKVIKLQVKLILGEFIEIEVGVYQFVFIIGMQLGEVMIIVSVDGMSKIVIVELWVMMMDVVNFILSVNELLGDVVVDGQ